MVDGQLYAGRMSLVQEACDEWCDFLKVVLFAQYSLRLTWGCCFVKSVKREGLGESLFLERVLLRCQCIVGGDLTHRLSQREGCSLRRYVGRLQLM